MSLKPPAHSSPTEGGPLIFGVAASLAYGFWGFFEKLSASDVVTTNLVVYAVAFLLSLCGLKHWRKPSATALIAGVAGGGINALVLYGLTHHYLVLVYPFVSFGFVFFLILHALFLKPPRLSKYHPGLALGLSLAVGGLALCGIGMMGGVSNIAWHSINIDSLMLSLLTSALTGLWIFLAYTTIVEQHYRPSIATTWVFLGSLSVAVCMAILPPSQISLLDVRPQLPAVLAGIFMFLGEYSTYHAFASSASNRSQQILSALLANSELVPIVLLSIFFLHERTLEGGAGAMLVLSGIVVCNLST